MATIQVDRTQCDREGCGRTGKSVTPRLELATFWEGAKAFDAMRDAAKNPAPPDLCGPCLKSVIAHALGVLRKKGGKDGES